MLHCWDCIGQVMSSAWFSPHIPLRIKAKKFYLGLIRPENPSGVFSKLHAGFHVSLHWGEASVGPLCHKAPTGGGLQWWLTFYNFLPSPECISGAQPQWSLGSSLPLSPRLFSPIAQFGRTASSRKGSGRPKRLPFKDYGGDCALRKLKCSRIFFCNLGQICALPQFCLWALQAVPLTSWFSFALTCTVSCKVLYRQVCGFPNQVQSV